MAISKIWSSYKPVSDLNTYVGETGEIFYDENTGELRISNGVTPGGLPISGSVTITNAVELDADTIAELKDGVELGPTTLAALENIEATINGDVNVSDITVAGGTITVDNAEDNPVPVSGTVTVDGGAISIDNFPATQTVDGDVSVSNLVDVNVIQPTNGFSEIIMSERSPIIERIPIKGVSDIRDIVETTGSATVDSSNFTEIQLSTGTTTSSQAILSTADRGRYQAGTLGQAGIGVRFDTSTAFTGTGYALWGYYDDNDGAYFGRDSGGVYTGIRRNGVETEKTYSANWNIDPMDGTGPCGINWNEEDGNIYQIEYSWYGFGLILFSLIDRCPITKKQRAFPVHSYRPTQQTNINYPNLPIRAEISNGDTTADNDMYVGGRQFSVLGKFNPASRVVNEWVSGVDITDTLSPIISVRSKTGRDNLSISKFVTGFDCIPSGENVYIEIRSNVTLTGDTWQAPNGYNSNTVATETNITATDYSGGNILWAGFVQSSGSGGGGNARFAGSRSEQGLTIEFHETQILTVLARTITAPTDTISLLLRWEEEL